MISSNHTSSSWSPNIIEGLSKKEKLQPILFYRRSFSAKIQEMSNWSLLHLSLELYVQTFQIQICKSKINGQIKINISGIHSHFSVWFFGRRLLRLCLQCSLRIIHCFHKMLHFMYKFLPFHSRKTIPPRNHIFFPLGNSHIDLFETLMSIQYYSKHWWVFTLMSIQYIATSVDVDSQRRDHLVILKIKCNFFDYSGVPLVDRKLRARSSCRKIIRTHFKKMIVKVWTLRLPKNNI